MTVEYRLEQAEFQLSAVELKGGIVSRDRQLIALHHLEIGLSGLEVEADFAVGQLIPEYPLGALFHFVLDVFAQRVGEI